MSEITLDLTEDIKARVTEKVTRILFKAHSHDEKKKIMSSNSRLNFACPYCGDSHDNFYKKRGNLYWNTLQYHCYNCEIHENINKFLEHFHEGLDIDNTMKVMDYIQNNQRDFVQTQYLSFHLFDELDKLALTFDEIAPYYGIYRVNQYTRRAYPYLKSRLLHKKLKYFGYDPKRNTLFIFNLNREGKIIGFQKRSLYDNHKGMKYITHNIQKIYEVIGSEISDKFDSEDLESINKISSIFNSMRVDYNQEITVFEGYMDAMFMKNSVGLSGVKKTVKDFDDIENVRYFFDSDRDGIIKMNQKIKEGKKVFLWKKFAREYNVKLTLIKDLNDIIKYEYKYKKGLLTKLESYFSDNVYDLLYV